MPKRTNKFQTLVMLLHHCFGGAARVMESAMLRDRVTGEEREVDVYIEAEASGYPTNLAVEAVARSRKADTTWVESMHAKHASLPTDKLILVSERGFTKPALLKAEALGVVALSIDAALAGDWKFAADLTATGIFALTTFRYGCAIVYDSPHGETLQEKEIGLLSTISIKPGPTTDTGEAGAAVTIDQLVRYALKQPAISNALDAQLRTTEERQFTLEYTPNAVLTTTLDEAVVSVKLVRIPIEVDFKETAVQHAMGRFRGTPFVSGSSDSQDDHKLQFVLIRNREGKIEGRVLDEHGIRALSGCEMSSKDDPRSD